MNVAVTSQLIYDALIKHEEHLANDDLASAKESVLELHKALNLHRRQIYPNWDQFLVMIDRAPDPSVMKPKAGGTNKDKP